MTHPFKPVKLGAVVPASDEWLLATSGFPKKGHLEQIPLTDEDRSAHARAVAAYEEVMSNPWIELSGYEYDFEVRPLEPRKVFVAEETDEEHMARWVEAGRPVRNLLQEAVERDLSASAIDSTRRGET